MGSPSVELASFVALPASKHGFEAVPAAIGRCSTSRVRQRPPSSRRQAAPRTPMSTMLRDRNRMPNDSCNGDSGVGAEIEQGGAKATRVPRFDGSSNVNSNGSGSGRLVSSLNSTSGSRGSSSSPTSGTTSGSTSNNSSRGSSRSVGSGSSNINSRSRSNGNSNRDADVYQSRNRMMAAGKRRRWADVRTCFEVKFSCSPHCCRVFSTGFTG